LFAIPNIREAKAGSSTLAADAKNERDTGLLRSG